MFVVRVADRSPAHGGAEAIESLPVGRRASGSKLALGTKKCRTPITFWEDISSRAGSKGDGGLCQRSFFSAVTMGTNRTGRSGFSSVPFSVFVIRSNS